MKWSGTEVQSRLQGKPGRILQPGWIVFEDGAFLVFANTGPTAVPSSGQVPAISTYTRVSLSIIYLEASSVPRCTDAFRKILFFKSEAHGVTFKINISDNLSAMPRTKKNRGTASDRHTESVRSTFMNVGLLMDARCAAIVDGNTTTTTGIFDLMAKLSQRRVTGRGGVDNSVFCHL